MVPAPQVKQKTAFDAIILGAGINGCGIARELAGQGRRVLVLVNATELSREYQLDRHRMEGTTLLHVFGGKLTTFLSLARKAAELLN